MEFLLSDLSWMWTQFWENETIGGRGRRGGMDLARFWLCDLGQANSGKFLVLLLEFLLLSITSYVKPRQVAANPTRRRKHVPNDYE